MLGIPKAPYGSLECPLVEFLGLPRDPYYLYQSVMDVSVNLAGFPQQTQAKLHNFQLFSIIFNYFQLLSIT